VTPDVCKDETLLEFARRPESP